jgi:hypothetical protein
MRGQLARVGVVERKMLLMSKKWCADQTFKVPLGPYQFRPLIRVQPGTR